MSKTGIDIVVVVFLFIFGVTWTVRRFSSQDRLAFTVVAVMSPLIAVFSVFRLFYLLATRRIKVGPVPVGLAEAELEVERERQRLFGGELRQPTFAKSWQRAYEVELQREAERVQRFAVRIFAIA